MASWSEAVEAAKQPPCNCGPVFVEDQQVDIEFCPVCVPELYDDEVVADDTVACDGCNGSGVYYGRGYVENGVFKGFTGTCFRCGGKGRQTESDVIRNRVYDTKYRRFTV